MVLTDLEEQIVAYYLIRDARKVFVNDRFYPRRDIVKIYERSIFEAVNQLPAVLECDFEKLARDVVERIVDVGGIKIVNDKYTGESLKFNILDYGKSINKLMEATPLLKGLGDFDQAYWDAKLS